VCKINESHRQPLLEFCNSGDGPKNLRAKREASSLEGKDMSEIKAKILRANLYTKVMKEGMLVEIKRKDENGEGMSQAIKTEDHQGKNG
jgi:hypothetical protein